MRGAPHLSDYLIYVLLASLACSICQVQLIMLNFEYDFVQISMFQVGRSPSILHITVMFCGINYRPRLVEVFYCATLW